MDVLRKDLDAIKQQGFVNVGLRTSWGEIMSKWDGESGEPTWNEASCSKLAAIAAECALRGLRLIFNTHLKDTVPEGVEGAFLVNHTAPDSLGVVPAPYWRSKFIDHMVRDSYREPMTAFHTKFATCLNQSPGVPRFWKHAFESAYIFPQHMSSAQITATAPAANEKFQAWARDQNADIRYWAERWAEGEYLTNFSMITIPHQTQHPMSKAKFGDFWRFWLLGVLKQGKYGLSIGDIYSGLAAGAGRSYVPGLAFKHVRHPQRLIAFLLLFHFCRPSQVSVALHSAQWKPKNFLGLSDLSTAELKEAFDLPINATAMGYYVNDPLSLKTEPSAFAAYIRDVKSVAPSALPLIVWETGASTRNLTEAQQAKWGSLMMQTLVAEGVAGFNWCASCIILFFEDVFGPHEIWSGDRQCIETSIPETHTDNYACRWQFIDWAPTPSQPCQGDTQCQLLHFGAHHLDGSPKPVWSVLKHPEASSPQW